MSTPNLGQEYPGLHQGVTLIPDGKGSVAGAITLSDIILSPGGPCTCGPVHVAYYFMTLTNLTTGHVYSVDPISRDFP